MQIVGIFQRPNMSSLISSRTQGSPGSSIPLRTLLQPLQIAAMTGIIISAWLIDTVIIVCLSGLLWQEIF